MDKKNINSYDISIILSFENWTRKMVDLLVHLDSENSLFMSWGCITLRFKNQDDKISKANNL